MASQPQPRLDGQSRIPWGIASVVALVACAILGVTLRLKDPLSSPLIGAEDPFTHIVFTKEHLLRGYFDGAKHLGLDLYPPGLHAFVGTVHVLTGISLEDLARFMPPVLFGGLAVVGVFVVARRLAGLAAGIVAGVAIAVMPEHVFRTNLLFPTALDLAVLPAFLLAGAELAEGRFRWTVVALMTGAVLAVSHPWVVPLTGFGVAGFLGLRFVTVTGGSARRLIGGGIALMGVLAVLMMLSTLVPDIEADFRGRYSSVSDEAPRYVGLAALALVGLIAARLVSLKLPAWSRGALGSIGVIAVLFVGLPRLVSELPAYVNYDHQLGRLAVVLALTGAVVLPLVPNRLGILGVGIVASTLPLTAINVFDSPYWPHRTVVYLAVGVALLAGSGAVSVLALASRVLPRRGGWHVAYAATAIVVTLTLVTSTVIAAPTPFAWYRFYDQESYEGIEWVLGELERDPKAVVVSGHWKSNALLKALGDEDRVVWGEAFVSEQPAREKYLSSAAENGRTVYLVIDDAFVKEAERQVWKLDFVDDAPFRPVGKWGVVRVYAVTPG